MLIKVLAVSMILLSGAFCGIEYSEKLKKRVAFCTEAEKMMRLSEIMIRSCGTDVYELVGRLKAEGYSNLIFLDKLSEEYSADEGFRESWRTAVMSLRNTGEEEKRALVEFGNFLGSTDISGQLSGIALQSELMHGIYERRQADYQKKGRLYRSLGILAGLTVGIIVI